MTAVAQIELASRGHGTMLPLWPYTPDIESRPQERLLRFAVWSRAELPGKS